jgi:OOP family OmpA-OmpF porin
MRTVTASLVALVALTGCTTTMMLTESTPVTVAANRPPAPPEPEPPPPPRVEVEATRIRVDEKIHFEFDRAEIRPDSDGLLREIAQVIIDNPQITRIRVEGHTDRQGRASYNQTLSRRRADAVVARLVENGVARERLTPEGFGFSRPIADNETEEGRAQNRRVEFNIVEQTGAAPAEAGQAETPDAPEGGGAEGAEGETP